MKKYYPVLLNVVLSFFFCVAATWVFADPPSQVMRLGYMDGTVTFSPSGVDQWVNATINRPIVTGDKLWTDKGAKTELQLGSAVLRMDEYTSINVLNVGNDSPQIELDQGIVNLHVWKMSRYKGFEIDTPNLAVSVSQPGDYRVDVNPTDNTTIVTVREGMAVVYGESNSYQINAGQSIRFSGTQLSYETLALKNPDPFDQWCAERNALYDKSASKQYVSPEVIGASDLDSNGQWIADSTYGNVWYPSVESSDWAPYSQGQWVWVEPWGWTWEDEQPWGFAPFHYGRWFFSEERHSWGWIPGPVDLEPVYAPALVAFYQGDDFGGAIGWFPLGPGDVYVPAYGYSRDYFRAVNESNTIISAAVINNVYGNPNRALVYRNFQAPHAVTAVSTQAFVGSQPTAKSAIAVPKAWANAHPGHAATLKPSNTSVIGNAAMATSKPSQKALATPVIAKTKPPAALKPTAGSNASQVKVIKGASTPVPISAKTNAVPGAKSAPITPTKPSGVAHPSAATPQVIHKPSTGTVSKPAVINAQPKAVTPQSKGVTPHPQAVTPQSKGVTPHPQAVTPRPKAVTPHPQAVTPRPKAVTPHHEAVTPRPQAAPQRPQAAPQRPQAAPQRPQAMPQRPQAVPQRPQAVPQRPQAVPQRPQAVPQRPQAVPPHPGVGHPMEKH